MRQVLIALIAMYFLMFSTAFAHDAWIEKKGDEFVVLYGHGDKIDPYDLKKIKEVKAFDTARKEISVEVKAKGDGAVVVPKGNAALITLYFDNGFWSKTPDGWKNKPKKEQPDAVESSHSVKYSKALTAWSDKLSKPLGMKMEIVPLKNPLSLKAGDILPIKVFFDGKSMEGASVDIGGYHKEDMKTDKNGMAEVKIQKAGSQIIAAGIKIPLKDNPDADILSISTNITFEVK